MLEGDQSGGADRIPRQDRSAVQRTYLLLVYRNGGHHFGSLIRIGNLLEFSVPRCVGSTSTNSTPQAQFTFSAVPSSQTTHRCPSASYPIHLVQHQDISGLENTELGPNPRDLFNADLSFPFFAVRRVRW